MNQLKMVQSTHIQVNNKIQQFLKQIKLILAIIFKTKIKYKTIQIYLETMQLMVEQLSFHVKIYSTIQIIKVHQTILQKIM